VVHADLPGVVKEDISVHVEGQLVTIDAVRHRHALHLEDNCPGHKVAVVEPQQPKSTPKKVAAHHISERYCGKFYRSLQVWVLFGFVFNNFAIQIPKHVDADHCLATYVDGVLVLQFGIKAKTSQGQMIRVN
jgi:HSP20 family molecular chaperone IbpA